MGSSGSMTKVEEFECIECGRQRTECNECFKECGHCYARDLAKVCWDCQREQVVLECTECDKSIEFPHASCIALDWQGLFARCCHKKCQVWICIDCRKQINGEDKGEKGVFRNCGF